MMRRQLKGAFAGLIRLVSRSAMGSYLLEEILNAAMSRQRVVTFGPHRLRFATPNRLATYRADTFATKEPETLTWIDSIPEGSVLWDIGANVGTYAIYAAKARNCRVYAFEPSVFNLELLARNIDLNQLQDRVTIVPLALSDRLGVNSFKMTTTTWGGALSTFGEDFDHYGMALKEIFEYEALGMSSDDAVSLVGIPQPDYLKVDVDGIEHLILKGARETLSRVKGVLIEINDSFRAQSDGAARLLAGAGLVLERKCDLGSPITFNQWWSRPGQGGGAGLPALSGKEQ